MKIIPAITIALLFSVGLLSGQTRPGWNPTRLQVSRPELQALLEQYQAVVESSAYSAGLRDDARLITAQIRERLEVGDFRVGDRIVLDVRGEEDVPDTVQVQPGPVVVLGQIGEIRLNGVLRSELQEHLTRELSRFIRAPVVYSRAMIRLAVEGQLGKPGFYVLPADMLFGEALMAAGGPATGADMNAIRVWRGESLLLDGDEVARAIIEGRSLDQLNMRAGDRIEVVAEDKGQANIWGSVLKYGLGAISMLVLGVKIF
jgi:protein involved in polysaccharide export with SLBB domain